MDIQDARSCWEEVKTRSPWLVLWFLSLNLCQDTAEKNNKRKYSHTRIRFEMRLHFHTVVCLCLSPKQAAKCEAPSVWRHGQADYYVHFRVIRSLSSRQMREKFGQTKGRNWRLLRAERFALHKYDYTEIQYMSAVYKQVITRKMAESYNSSMIVLRKKKLTSFFA